MFGSYNQSNNWGFKSPSDDESEICLEISDNNDFDSQPSQFYSSSITPIVNVATTPILNTAATPKHHSDDIETDIKSLEDKLLSKIAALKSHLFNDVFDLRDDITLLKENNEKEKQLIQIMRKTKYCCSKKNQVS